MRWRGVKGEDRGVRNTAFHRQEKVRWLMEKLVQEQPGVRWWWDKGLVHHSFSLHKSNYFSPTPDEQLYHGDIVDLNMVLMFNKHKDSETPESVRPWRWCFLMRLQLCVWNQPHSWRIMLSTDEFSHRSFYHIMSDPSASSWRVVNAGFWSLSVICRSSGFLQPQHLCWLWEPAAAHTWAGPARLLSLHRSWKLKYLFSVGSIVHVNHCMGYTVNQGWCAVAFGKNVTVERCSDGESAGVYSVKDFRGTLKLPSEAPAAAKVNRLSLNFVRRFEDE